MQTIRNGNKKFQKGILIVEILIAIAIITVISATIFGAVAIYLKTSIAMKETVQANMLAQEAMEAVRSYRDAILWNNDDLANQYDGLGVVDVDTPYRVQKSGDNPPKWMLVQGAEAINGFSRSIFFDTGLRDGNNNIVSSGGSSDLNTKKVVVMVSWKDKNVELAAYLTNWR